MSILVGAVLLVATLFLARWFIHVDTETRAKAAKIGLAIVVVLAFVLIFFGLRLPFVITGLFVLIPFLPYFFQQETQELSKSAVSTHMTLEEARQILGVKARDTEEEILKAYRRIIQKVHPDKGGSAYLAAKVNHAKDVLLKN
ncbi:DnaJ domain-containing protein [Candidatus Nucleicultrix amoebiphila]|jgi:DnaJ-domain-containing protein 1|uniref:J domain-containing protein n=1 Tax=Candidatus Nucleicultrix amoebiphila FS5 TaxID=1414854 RepID=A0A1W6N6B1_9PROT|nr:DnaJ domain-containing protein [Candidatus Nucleicultrix amoebiphila]ARN85435.1 hypothetical protein GQ61_09205 [Candidatus Nucleicultrix amoebiphila FS5]